MTTPRTSKKPRSNVELVDLTGRGWSCMGECVAVVRLRDRPGFAVGVQAQLRSGGVARVWSSLHRARHRAAYLAAVNNLPIVEAL